MGTTCGQTRHTGGVPHRQALKFGTQPGRHTGREENLAHSRGREDEKPKKQMVQKCSTTQARGKIWHTARDATQATQATQARVDAIQATFLLNSLVYLGTFGQGQ